jgi:hypothetical protein
VELTKEIGRKDKCRDSGSKFGVMATNIKENGSKENSMDKVKKILPLTALTI